MDLRHPNRRSRQTIRTARRLLVQNPTHRQRTTPARHYEHDGISRLYEPDFIVRLTNGVHLVLEIKGFEPDQVHAKHAAAKRWISAVNNWGKLKKWDFLVCKDPQLLGNALKELVSSES